MTLVVRPVIVSSTCQYTKHIVRRVCSFTVVFLNLHRLNRERYARLSWVRLSRDIQVVHSSPKWQMSNRQPDEWPLCCHCVYHARAHASANVCAPHQRIRSCIIKLMLSELVLMWRQQILKRVTRLFVAESRLSAFKFKGRLKGAFLYFPAFFLISPPTSYRGRDYTRRALSVRLL